MNILLSDARRLLQGRKMEELKFLLNQASLIEILELFEECSKDQVVVLFRLLNKEKSLEVFEALDLYYQEKLLLSFTEEKVIETIAELAPDDRVKLFDELPARVTKKLLFSLSPEERKKTANLMGYAPQTAGRLMTPEYVRLKENITVEGALDKIRNLPESIETLYTLYVTDSNRKLIGVLSLKDLVLAKPEQLIKDIMETHLIKVSTDTDQEETANILYDGGLLAVPVVDSEDRLVGIITVDDAIGIIEQEATEDIYNKAGLISSNKKESKQSAKLIDGTYLDALKVRLPFLMITMFGGFLAGKVIHLFESTFLTLTAVAVFIPVIMDMGGNVGTQSSTIFNRALILGQINIHAFWKHILREMGVGFFMGIVMGALAGLMAAYWQRIPMLGVVVGLALIVTITLATILGFFIPYILMKMGLDQAAGADPIITTIKDVTGLLIYFLLVRLFFAYLMPV
jgi:magnesium transporter